MTIRKIPVIFSVSTMFSRSLPVSVPTVEGSTRQSGTPFNTLLLDIMQVENQNRDWQA